MTQSFVERRVVRERTDGLFVVSDDRLKLGEVAVICRSVEAAKAAAEDLLARGCPLVVADEPTFPTKPCRARSSR